jgi:hypothetical protein
MSRFRKALVVAVAALATVLPPVASADALENAYYVCDIFDKTGISTECQIEHVVHQIDVKVATTGADAQNICAVITQRLAEKKRFFGGDWKLRVLSPEQTADPLAECPLR